MASLYIFSASYPFGAKETYLEEEVQILSEYFNIIIQPHYYNNKDTSLREVPNNVTVCKPALPLLKSKRLFQCLIGLLRKPQLFLFFIDFINNGDFLSLDHLKRFILTLIDYLATLGSTQYKSISKLKNQKLYFYWGVGWSYSVLNSKVHSKNDIFIRLHGGEVFLDRSNGYIPLRKKLFEKADIILPISNLVKKYIINEYDVLSSKIKVSYLGVALKNELNPPNSEKTIKIVSCSNVIDLKRIDLIIKALAKIKDQNISWSHFGDGPLLKKLIQLSKKELDSENISFNFKGRVSNNKVLEFYKNNSVDAFINVSLHEGLPLSIMEAMSYGIPCIATSVGATSEIVNNMNGILLNKNFSLNKLVKSISSIHSNDWKIKREFALQSSQKYFNSARNYKDLAKILNN